ncbi:3-hydroxybutyryl-CoA dehydrogenase [Planctomycetota bacterium]|nr:3-hydroxybutyryl-CoA dehydrogenase [Planctomycetota bacterium]MDB4736369.1 3-hydroxybutyryl-CoA dehydrogenase [Planctomycetota bacterium]
MSSNDLFERVAVIGAGTMGNGIAQVFASCGSEVTLVDVNGEALERGVAAIGKSLARVVKKERMSQEDADAAMARISRSTRLEDLTDRELVVEAVSERADLKAKIFRTLDEVTPASTILASNTSSISITEIAAVTGRADKVIGMHFMNPVPVMKLVEVIRGQETSDETTDAVMRASCALGKEPVEANDYPGFVSNRVLMPMINEAVFCLMEGVATKEGIDTVMKLGMAHPMGPLTLADLIGLDVCLDILEVLHRGLGDDKYRPCPLLRRMVAAGRLGRKSGKGFYDYE